MATSKMTQIYVGLGAIAVLGGFWWTQHKKDKALTNTTYVQGSTAAAPQFKVVPEEIDKIVLKAKDKPEVTLEKKGAEWSMAAPVAGAKIQKSSVDDILNGLKGVSFKDPIAKGKDQFAAYDLDEGKAIHVVASKGGAAVIDLWIGAQKSRGLMARLGNEEQIWSVSGLSSWSFDKAPKDVRDKKVWDLQRDNVTSIELRDSKGSFAFSKVAAAPSGDAGAAGGDAAAAPSGDGGAALVWGGLQDGKPMANLDPAKVDDLVNAFSLGGLLNADDFGDGKSDAETGLGGTEATAITFHLKDGGVARIVLGKAEGTKRYARKEGDTTVFVLGEGPSGWGDTGADKLNKPAPAAGDAGTDGAAAADAKK